jgi:hypothetical protein
MEKENINSIELSQDIMIREKSFKGCKINLCNKKTICIVIEQSSQNTLKCSIDDIDRLVGAQIYGLQHSMLFTSKITEDDIPCWARVSLYTSKQSVEFYAVDAENIYSKDDVEIIFC